MRGLKKANRGFIAAGGIFLLVVWLAVFCFPIINASAATDVTGVYDYTVIGEGKCMIEGYRGTGGDIVIPSTLSDGTNTYTVALIDAASTFPHAMASSDNLTGVTLPASVTAVGTGPFQNCNNLKYINVDAGNSYYISVDGVLFDKNMKTLIQYPGGKTGLYTVPTGVNNIEEYAFYSCTGLTSVTIPNSVTSIGRDAFMSCTSLTDVSIPNSITSIGMNAFHSCSNLTSLNLGTDIQTIGEFAFFSCGSLTSINVDSANTNYASADGVLFNKTQTTLIQYPGGKTGAYTIPAGVTIIGDWAFNECAKLTGVAMPDSVTSIGANAFRKCSNLTSITLGTHIQTILESAFYSTGLKRVTITDKVTYIGSYAFAACPLEAVYFRGNLPDMGVNAALGGATVYAPTEKGVYGFDWYGYPLQGYSYGLIYKGAQKKSNGSSYDIRFIATIESLEPASVGFVYSTTNSTPTLEGTDSHPLSTTAVYTSIIANGIPKTAVSLGGTYIVAYPASGFQSTDTIYVRTFATKGTETEYGQVFTVTPASL